MKEVENTLKVIQTADGSRSLLHSELNTAYHSVHGALQESRHIFIQHGLLFAADRFRQKLNVLEIGFGTGLNALLSLEFANRHQTKINYRGIEKFPVPAPVQNELDYASTFEPAIRSEIQGVLEAPWNATVHISDYFELYKSNEDARWLTPLQNLHLIYFDAFAPAHSPELWQESLFSTLYQSMAPGGILVTFCAKGSVKRLLKSCGFGVEALPGPPGKREMTRAIKPF